MAQVQELSHEDEHGRAHNKATAKFNTINMPYGFLVEFNVGEYLIGSVQLYNEGNMYIALIKEYGDIDSADEDGKLEDPRETRIVSRLYMIVVCASWDPISMERMPYKINNIVHTHLEMDRAWVAKDPDPAEPGCPSAADIWTLFRVTFSEYGTRGKFCLYDMVKNEGADNDFFVLLRPSPRSAVKEFISTSAVGDIDFNYELNVKIVGNLIRIYSDDTAEFEITCGINSLNRVRLEEIIGHLI